MTSIDKQLTELKAHLEELTTDELRLIKELEEALIKADNQLENEIDSVFTAHLRRRENLASSLVELARNLGRLPLPSPQAATLDYARSNGAHQQHHNQPAATTNTAAWDIPEYEGQISAEDIKLTQ